MRKWLTNVRSFFQSKALILMYHRVDELACDPWQLAVHPDHFEEHLRVIRQQWTPISLAQLNQDIACGSIADRSIVVTFDDGYIDNFDYARPLLEQYNIPATFFIPTQNCEQQQPFWWDELQTILLETEQLPEQFILTIADDTLSFTLGNEAWLSPDLRQKHDNWIASDPPPTQRSQLYLDAWRRLRPLTHVDQQRVLTQLRQFAGQPTAHVTRPVCMTPTQLRQVATNPLFSLGAHTVTHPALAHQPPGWQLSEINGSRMYLEQLLQQPITLFAYPYGSYTDATVAMLTTEPIEVAVTTHEGPITTHSQLLQLNRYQVTDLNGTDFAQQLSRWYGPL